MGLSLHRLQAKSRGVNEPLRQLEVRVGSATDALTPVSRATRSFAATRAQWLALAAIALAAVVADQVTKPSRTRSVRFETLPPITSPSATGSTGWRAPERAK